MAASKARWGAGTEREGGEERAAVPGLGRSVTRSRQGRRRGSTRRRGGQAPLTLRPRYPQEAVGPSMRGLPAAGCVPRQGGRRRCGAVRCLRPSWQLLPCLPAGRCRFRTKLGASVVYGVLWVKCRHLWLSVCLSEPAHRLFVLLNLGPFLAWGI